MVYYGVVSRGCQRCRQRKVKCDLRKPRCLRCEKSKTECPGFRNLADVLFRDESERIIQKAHAFYEARHALERAKPSIIQDEVTKDASISSPSVHSAFPTPQSYAIAHRSESAFFDFLPATSIPYGISQPTNDLGAHFFFANYTCDDPPLSVAYYSWLTKTYLEESPNHALRTAIEAAGMAGISNRFYAPHIAAKSKVQYGRALAATKQALDNPVKSIEDSTLAAVILLGFFEFITCESWDRYRSWVAHIKGATALLRLRGQKQFTYERGGQLYKQLFSQLLYAFVLLDVAIHPSVNQFRPELRLSVIEQHGKNRSGVLGDICFRLLQLRLGIKNGEITDQQAIREAGTKLDNDLEAWKASRGPGWLYTTVDASSPVPKDKLYYGKHHLYSQIWTAYLWNNWRTLRILINRIMVQNEMISEAPDHNQKAASLSLIHGMSTEICVSVASFFGSPRASSLIWPLFIVSEETLNPLSQRIWAMNQLRAIGSSMGIRLAGLLAATISQSLHVAPPS